MPPHTCSVHWTDPPVPGPPVNWMNRLGQLVQQEDDNQRNHGYIVGGWAYWIPTQADFDALRDTFVLLCLALDVPAVPPGLWVGGAGVPPPFQPVVEVPPPVPVDATPPGDIGNAAGRVLAGLAADGQAPGNHPFFGVHGWLQDGNGDPASFTQALSLREILRNALDR